MIREACEKVVKESTGLPARSGWKLRVYQSNLWWMGRKKFDYLVMAEVDSVSRMIDECLGPVVDWEDIVVEGMGWTLLEPDFATEMLEGNSTVPYPGDSHPSFPFPYLCPCHQMERYYRTSCPDVIVVVG
jgi:hypothetical protein